jgi:uncharacterized protein (DUF849 family)
MQVDKKFHYESITSDHKIAPEKIIVTCSINGVLTNPQKFKQVPVSAEQMADACEQAWNEGATVVHMHLRDQREGLGHLPTWEAEVAARVGDAVKRRCPELLLNLTTGTIGDEGPLGGGDLGPCGGPIACMDAMQPHMAARNSGSLNYLKLTSKGTWAWPPMLFDNQVPKINTMLEAMKDRDIVPECECFDTGILRSIKMFDINGMMPKKYTISLVMGVASGMPARPEWLPLLKQEMPNNSMWQVIAIGRQEVWPLLRRCAELGGHVRTGLEDTFYLPDGKRAQNNGELINALVRTVREVGRTPTTIQETRLLYGMHDYRAPKLRRSAKL